MKLERCESIGVVGLLSRPTKTMGGSADPEKRYRSPNANSISGSHFRDV